MRRTVASLASAIPRSVWDPQHHDTKWVDSYAKPIARRRSWPGKVYPIIREPTTPRDWLSYSKRNMAYSYNAALRACSNFADMVPLYQEMKLREVLIDVDTAFVLLSRGARYERMTPEDLFLIADEVRGLGARFDIAVVEVLHTVWDYSKAKARPEWREARRRELIDLYHDLARSDIAKYGEKGLDQLMLREMHRYVRHLNSLGGCLRADVWAMMLAHVNNQRDLSLEVCAMLNARAPKGAETVLIRAGPIELVVPDLSKCLRRASDAEDSVQPWARSGLPARDPAELGYCSDNFEDSQVNKVFLAAVERVVDANFFEHSKVANDRALVMQLLLIMWQSRVMISSDVFAQLMDVVKYSPPGDQRDTAARAFLRRAVRGANAARSPQLDAWVAEQRPLDSRVAARYLSSVDAWSKMRYTYSYISDAGGSAKKFGFAPWVAGEVEASDAVAQPAADATAADPAVAAAAPASEQAPTPTPRRTSRTGRGPSDIDMRMKDALSFIAATAPSFEAKRHTVATKDTPAHIAPYLSKNGVELFTGRAMLMRNLLRGLSGSIDIDTAAALFKHVAHLKADIDAVFEFAATRSLPALEGDELPLSEGPETACWEAMFTVLNSLMDVLLSHAMNHSIKSERARADEAFKVAAKLRDVMLQESKERYNGKLRALWLQEC